MAERSSRTRSILNTPVVSLMQPEGVAPLHTPTAPWAQDLGLDDLIRAFNVDKRQAAFIRQALTALTTNPVIIRWRQDVLTDFLQNPELVERVAGLLPRLTNLRMGNTLLGGHKRGILLETADRLAELDLYLNVVQELYAALNHVNLHAEALRILRQNLLAISQDEQFQHLRAQLPELQGPLRNIRSLTIGVNLDDQLQPRAATLLSINERSFTDSRSLLSRLLGTGTDDNNESGLAPLNYTPSDPEQRPFSPLFQDLERLIMQSTQPVARALARYVRISSSPLNGLENELAFYTAAASLIRRLATRGITFCQPVIAPADERFSHIEVLVNLHLALRETAQIPVGNDLTFDDQGRIAVLTGPNSGGKTTYVQAVGLAHMLFQAGLPIPAHSARISPVDAIFTHYPVLETHQGRLVEEATRLRQICLQATRYSLVLLNESLASTTAGEAFYLAQDLLNGLRVIGVRAVYATHLVELAEHLAEFATIEGESDLYSLVAGVRLVEDESKAELHATPTFKIARGMPQGRGYAREIARRYGISLEQILQARNSPPT
jgi:DNA mismatch repair protein MutS